MPIESRFADMKILIVKLGAIGDIVHALPIAAEIRRKFPQATIGWLADKRSAAILRDSPAIDELIEIDTRAVKGPRMMSSFRDAVGKQLKDIRDEKYDIALDLQGLLKSAIASKMSGAPVRFGFSRKDLREPSARVFYTETAAAVDKNTHIIQKNFALANAAFGVEFNGAELEFPIAVSEAERAETAGLLNEPFALLNPGGGWPTKLWHAEKFGLLADLIHENLGLRSIISIGPGEDDLVERAMKSSKIGASLTAKLSIKGFYELAKHAQVYVGGDTGPTHIAVAAGTPVVGIFGPTEWWRNGSPNPEDICVGRSDIECRIACHRRSCSKWICMDIDVRTVFDAVKLRIDKSKAITLTKSSNSAEIAL